MNGPNRPLDRTDRQILALLQEDARLANKELAARIGLAPSSCHTRVQRLVAEGVLAGFHAEVRRDALGIGLEALVQVRMARHRREDLDGLRRALRARPEVIEVFHLAGPVDLIVHVAVRDPDHLRELTLAGISERDEVDRVETALVFDGWRSSTWPDLIDDDSASGGPAQSPKISR